MDDDFEALVTAHNVIGHAWETFDTIAFPEVCELAQSHAAAILDLCQSFE